MFLATNECGHLRTSLSASARLRPTVPLNSAYHNLAASLIAIIWRPLYTTVLVLMVWWCEWHRPEVSPVRLLGRRDLTDVAEVLRTGRTSLSLTAQPIEHRLRYQ